MEERADSIKSNTTQAMLKINTLEQENVSCRCIINLVSFLSQLLKIKRAMVSYG